MSATLDNNALRDVIAPRADTVPSGDSLYRTAVHFLQHQDYERAEENFWKALRENRKVTESYNGLGVLYQRQNKIAEAIVYFLKAIDSASQNAGAHFNLGLAYKSQNNWQTALASFEQAVLLQRGNPEFIAKYAEACEHCERIDEAIAALEQYMVYKPDHEHGWIHLASLYVRAKAPAAAIRCYREAYRISPKSLIVLNNLGWLLHNSTQYDAALAVLENAVEQFPQECALWRNLGETYQKLERDELALLCLTHAIDIKPEDSANHYQLGYFYSRRGRHSEALDHFRRAISLNENSFDAYNMLANTHIQIGQAEQALPLFERAIAINPRDASFHVNWAVALRKLGRYAEASAAFDRALAVDPKHAEGTFGKALLALLHGDFAAGWKGYESRRTLNGFVGINELDIPRWEGESLRQKRIFVHAEQGFGDTFQFIRYLSVVQQKYHPQEVVFSCDPNLATLLKYTPGCTRLVCDQTPPPEMDCHVNLLSIPAVVGTQIETIPNDFPYIIPDPIKTDVWASRLRQTQSLRVGFVWRGHPNHVNDRNRSSSIHPFMALIQKHQAIDYVSLQLGPTAEELRALQRGEMVQDLGSLIGDFADTAAIIQNLHLVISVDTAVAHLAGAMGKPVWTLLSFDPDWRWLLESLSSPWYPTMRLFRQSRPADWDSLFVSLDQALEAWQRSVN